MAVVTTNVLVGQATLYTAPTGTTYPLDTLAPGAAWLTPWVHVGATEEGVSFAVGGDIIYIRIEEQMTPVAAHKGSANIRILASLSEDTVETMKLAYGGGTITTQAAGAGLIGKKTLRLSEAVDILAAGFEGRSPAGLFRRVHIPKIVSVADVTTPYRRAANNRNYAIELQALCALDEILIVDQTAVAS